MKIKQKEKKINTYDIHMSNSEVISVRSDQNYYEFIESLFGTEVWVQIVEGKLKVAICTNHILYVSNRNFEDETVTKLKAGSIPANTMPIGTEKKLTDGYIRIKINDLPRVKKQENWVQKQRVVYEKHYGKIPEGYVVIFLDRNRENFDPENLAAIKRSELARLNKQGMIYDDTNLTKAGIGIVRLSSKISEREKK